MVGCRLAALLLAALLLFGCCCAVSGGEPEEEQWADYDEQAGTGPVAEGEAPSGAGGQAAG